MPRRNQWRLFFTLSGERGGPHPPVRQLEGRCGPPATPSRLPEGPHSACWANEVCQWVAANELATRGWVSSCTASSRGLTASMLFCPAVGPLGGQMSIPCGLGRGVQAGGEAPNAIASGGPPPTTAVDRISQRRADNRTLLAPPGVARNLQRIDAHGVRRRAFTWEGRLDLSVGGPTAACGHWRGAQHLLAASVLSWPASWTPIGWPAAPTAAAGFVKPASQALESGGLGVGGRAWAARRAGAAAVPFPTRSRARAR